MLRILPTAYIKIYIFSKFHYSTLLFFFQDIQTMEDRR